MNKLTAYRTFGNPGYTPAQRVKVYNNRYYLVTLQNVESDSMTDYLGLADGEYVKLMNGQQAREARDARLNHCNAISEYHGCVYEYRQEYRDPEYFTSAAECDLRVCQLQTTHEATIASCQREAESHEAMTPESIIASAKLTGIGISHIGDQKWLANALAWHKRIASTCREAMRTIQLPAYTTRRIR